MSAMSSIVFISLLVQGIAKSCQAPSCTIESGDDVALLQTNQVASSLQLQEETLSTSDGGRRRRRRRRKDRRRDQAAPSPAPYDGPLGGMLLGRPNTSISKFTGGGKCPPTLGYPAPPDGLGLGYQWLEKELQGKPGRSIPGAPFATCLSCPSCQSKASTVYKGLIFKYRDGNATLLNQILSPTIKWTVIGYGATGQGCYGHTYMNSTENANKCYSFAARLSDIFTPNMVEDIMVDSCGKRAMVRLFCADCVDLTTRPEIKDYPQRYQWMFELEDDKEAPQGFYITKLDALLDTELTQYTSLASYDIDPFVCQPFRGPISSYPPIPQPVVNRVDLPLQDANTTCDECANCSSTMSVLEPAVLAFAKGDYAPLQGLLSPTVFWAIPGQGPTLAACAAKLHHSATGPFLGKNAFFRRLKAMTMSQEYVNGQIYLNYCGQKANFVWWSRYTGKSGYTYTMTMTLAMHLEALPLGKNSFQITEVIHGLDTEVFMNMASREKKFDSMSCSKVGPYSQAISRTLLQP